MRGLAGLAVYGICKVLKCCLDFGVHLIASNFSPEFSSEDILLWYNQRGEASENRIKELKNDFGMERMPSGEFGANAMFFSIGALAYNLYVLFKMLVLGENHRRERVLTTRWRLFNTAGHVVYHARQVVLMVSARLARWLSELRTRIYEIYLEVALE